MTTATVTCYTVTHGNCFTYHDTYAEAKEVFDRGGCRWITAHFSDFTEIRL